MGKNNKIHKKVEPQTNIGARAVADGPNQSSGAQDVPAVAAPYPDEPPPATRLVPVGNPSDGASTSASASSMPAPSFGRAPPQPTPTRGVPCDGGDVASGSAESVATQKGGKGKGKASQAGSSK